MQRFGNSSLHLFQFVQQQSSRQPAKAGFSHLIFQHSALCSCLDWNLSPVSVQTCFDSLLGKDSIVPSSVYAPPCCLPQMEVVFFVLCCVVVFDLFIFSADMFPSCHDGLANSCQPPQWTDCQRDEQANNLWKGFQNVFTETWYFKGRSEGPSGAH